MRLPEWDDPDRRDAALERLHARMRTPDALTRRQLAVIFLLSHGMNTPEIAATLGVKGDTVREHAKLAHARLGARTHAHAVATALRMGLIE